MPPMMIKIVVFAKLWEKESLVFRHEIITQTLTSYHTARRKLTLKHLPASEDCMLESEKQERKTAAQNTK